MAQQTAVEWLVKELNQELDYIPIKQWDRIRNLVQQAKAIEKEQIIDACFEGMNTFPFDANKGRAEQYYEQTYKTK